MPNISADVLRAQCAELRQQLQDLGVDRDRWRDQAKAILAMLPDKLEKARQGGMREAYTRVLSWKDCVPTRATRELVALGVDPGEAECKWCAGRGYIRAVCPACRCGLPDEEGT